MATQEQLKWEGKLTKQFHGSTQKQIWSFFEDFGNIHKYHPFLDTCYYVEGANAQPGSIRYCGASVGNEGEIKWCKEKLVEINPMEKSMKYEVSDNNFGISSYETSIKVLPSNEEGGGCQIEWSFVGEPVEGFTFEGYFGFLESILQGMVEKMEKELLSSV
ncbi:hypothetical protein Leryth_021348 [Lithospermum erythrorhizon]|nr:hypothetical protein Leryth_021348 [Lithospermum erythrorhizon]